MIFPGDLERFERACFSPSTPRCFASNSSTRSLVAGMELSSLLSCSDSPAETFLDGCRGLADGVSVKAGLDLAAAFVAAMCDGDVRCDGRVETVFRTVDSADRPLFMASLPASRGWAACPSIEARRVSLVPSALTAVADFCVLCPAFAAATTAAPLIVPYWFEEGFRGSGGAWKAREAPRIAGLWVETLLPVLATFESKRRAFWELMWFMEPCRLNKV